MMRRHYVNLFIFCLLGSQCYAIDPGCFDFREEKPKPIGKPLKALPSGDNLAFGKLSKGVVWGAARATIDHPIKYVYDKFLDHRIVKDMTKTEIQVKEEPHQGYLTLHEVLMKVKVASFITVRWREEWAYILEAGTVAKPKKIHIFYQKLKGTRHLQHLCGEMILTAKGPKQTDLYLYEQVRATRRTAEATKKMHQGTLRKLRAGK